MSTFIVVSLYKLGKLEKNVFNIKQRSSFKNFKELVKAQEKLHFDVLWEGVKKQATEGREALKERLAKIKANKK